MAKLDNEKITALEFQDWFGSDHCENWVALTDLILSLLNAEYSMYSIDDLREDIKSYA